MGFLRDDELGFESLVVEDESSQDRIEIQRSLEFDTQDQAAGMDTYCLVRSSGETYYGGVSDWAVRSSVLVLGLSAEAAAALQLPTRSEIPIDIGAELLEQHLGRLLAMAPMTT